MRNLIRTGIFAALIGFAFGTFLSFAGTGDQWIRRGSQVATELVKGNPQGAVQQAIPYKTFQPAQETNINLGSSGVNLQQGIPGINRLDTKYLNVGGIYHAGASLGTGGRPNFSQNVQVSSGNQYVTNTTTFAPAFGRRRS